MTLTPTHPTFEAWIADLEIIMDEYAAEYGGGRPYGDGTLAEMTGLESWRGYYDDAYSPREAFEEDQTYWD